MKGKLVVMFLVFSGLTSCLPERLPGPLERVPVPTFLVRKTQGPVNSRQSFVRTYGLVTVVYLPGSGGSPSPEELDAWYREASWKTDLPARGVLILAGRSGKAAGPFRSDSLPGGISILAGNGDASWWKGIMGRSLLLASTHPLARGFVPRWCVLGVSGLASAKRNTIPELLDLAEGRRVLFDRRGFSLDPSPEQGEDELLLSTGFLFYLLERYGEHRVYQYLNGVALDPGAAEGKLFRRMFGISFETALSQYCEYLTRGARL